MGAGASTEQARPIDWERRYYDVDEAFSELAVNMEMSVSSDLQNQARLKTQATELNKLKAEIARLKKVQSTTVSLETWNRFKQDFAELNNKINQQQKAMVDSGFKWNQERQNYQKDIKHLKSSLAVFKHTTVPQLTKLLEDEKKRSATQQQLMAVEVEKFKVSAAEARQQLQQSKAEIKKLSEEMYNRTKIIIENIPMCYGHGEVIEQILFKGEHLIYWDESPDMMLRLHGEDVQRCVAYLDSVQAAEVKSSLYESKKLEVQSEDLIAERLAPPKQPIEASTLGLPDPSNNLNGTNRRILCVTWLVEEVTDAELLVIDPGLEPGFEMKNGRPRTERLQTDHGIIGFIFFEDTDKAKQLSESRPVCLPYQFSYYGKVPLTRVARPTRRYAKAGLVPDEPLYTENLQSYYGFIDIGTPPQRFYTDFDTGSNRTWQACSTCTQDSCAKPEIGKFDCSASSTCNRTDVEFGIQYHDGDLVQGHLIHDHLCIAGYRTKSPIAIGCADRMKGMWDQKMPAIFGLDIQGMPESALHSIFEDKENCPEPIFSFYMNTTLDKDGKGAGEITFCEADTEHYEGEITWVPVDPSQKDRAWMVMPEKFMANGKEFPGELTYIDSGSTIMYVPDEVLKNLDLPAEPYPCANATELPVISIYLGGREIKMTGADYSRELSSSGTCILGIQGSRQSGMPWFSLFGDIFMRKMYTVFDYGNRRIGFADLKTPKKPACSTTTPHY
ncbi:unnamed protein product, partial [Mesorhabditis spiculigera]